MNSPELIELQRAEGKWWIPGREHEKLDATLCHEQDRSVQLRMAQLGFAGEFRADFILGKLQDGRPVTAYRTWVLDADTNQVVYGAEAAFIGIHVTSEEDLRFQVMSVSYPELDSWLSMTFIDTDKTVPFVAGGFHARFIQGADRGPVAETQAPKKAVWYLSLKSNDTVPFGDLRHIHLRRVTAFMTLARFDALMPCELRFGRAASDGIGDVTAYVAGMSTRAPEPAPLLWYHNADGRVGGYLDKWLASGPRFDEVYDLYVSAVQARGASSRNQFLMMIQALEGYLRISQGAAACYLGDSESRTLRASMLRAARELRPGIPADFVRDVLPHKLNRIAEWTLSKRLKKHQLDLRPALTKPTDGDFINLSELSVPLRRMVEVRNLLTHVDEPSPSRPAPNWEETGVLSRFAKLLLEASLLRTMGMHDPAVAAAMYWQYQHHGDIQARWEGVQRALQGSHQ